jgi:hypothetical protein
VDIIIRGTPVQECTKITTGIAEALDARKDIGSEKIPSLNSIDEIIP